MTNQTTREQIVYLRTALKNLAESADRCLPSGYVLSSLAP